MHRVSEQDRNIHVRVFDIECMREERQAKVKTAMKKDDKAKMEQTRAGNMGISCIQERQQITYSRSGPVSSVPKKRGKLLFFSIFLPKISCLTFLRTKKNIVDAFWYIL